MVSLFGMDDHHVEVSTAEASRCQGREVIVVLDLEVFQELVDEVVVIVANENVTAGVEKDHALSDCGWGPAVP